MTTAGKLLRSRGQHDSGRVSMVELFFDLVFVFAVTQLSHSLLAHLTPAGATQTLLQLVAVWWVWIYTSWVTNWLDPERIPVRLCLFVLTLAGLVLSSSLPEAFNGRGLAFAGSYVFMQVGRTIFFLWAVRDAPIVMRRNFQRILVWFIASGILWLTGAWMEGSERFTWWTAALLVDAAGPLVYFRVPGLGRSYTQEWNIDGNHLAERCALFVIIALGESILVTGATFAELVWNSTNILAFAIAILGSMAMWWIYFDTGAERAHHRIVHSNDPGRQARSAYTYLHALIVAGVIVCAVADELVLMHPDHATGAGLAAILGGPALYLAGNALFKWTTNDRRIPPLSHLAGIVLIAALIPFANDHHFSAIGFGALTTAILVLVAVWESLVLRRPVPAVINV